MGTSPASPASPAPGPASNATAAARPADADASNCSKKFEDLWRCLSPMHQLGELYRQGVLENCSQRRRAWLDCLAMRTRLWAPAARDRVDDVAPPANPIWQLRTPEEAAVYWEAYKANPLATEEARLNALNAAAATKTIASKLQGWWGAAMGRPGDTPVTAGGTAASNASNGAAKP